MLTLKSNKFLKYSFYWNILLIQTAPFPSVIMPNSMSYDLNMQPLLS